MLAMMDQKGSTMNIDLRSPALNWINGEWVDSAQHTESINPATGEVIGTYADGWREEAVLGVIQLDIHLGIQTALHKGFSQLLEDAALTCEVFGLGKVFEQLV